MLIVFALFACADSSFGVLITEPACSDEVLEAALPIDVPSSLGPSPQGVLDGLDHDTWLVTPDTLGGPPQTTVEWDLDILDASVVRISQNPEIDDPCEQTGDWLSIVVDGTVTVDGWGEAFGTVGLRADADGVVHPIPDPFLATLEPDIGDALATELDVGCTPADLAISALVTSDGVSFAYDGECADARTGGEAFTASPL